ncbi:MAG: multidrug efflux SMR transporter [Candidatus Saccharimonadales bacterium]
MVYLYLVGAIISEVIGTISLKYSVGFSKLLPSILVVLAYSFSFFLLSLSLKKLEVGMAYAIWSGLGTALVVSIGIIVLKEEVSVLKVASVALIIAGVIGLNLAKAH